MIRAVWIISILIVVIGSLLPATSAPMRALSLLPVSDKAEHFCAYGWLALCSMFAIAPKRAAILFALALILMGVALEFAQRLVPGRAFEVGDMAANALGVLAGISLGLLLPRFPTAHNL
jgi:VanZ family protein